MFVSEARSVTLQARLAITLAWIAGYTNAITLLTCNTASSHMSGATSSLGIAVVERNWPLAILTATLLGAFVLGAALAAAAIEFAKLRNVPSIYVVPMILQALLLLGFALCIEFVPQPTLITSYWLYVALGLAAGAMGVQNSTITSISRGVVRTTHVTGVLTDLGHETVQLLFRTCSAAARVAQSLDEGSEPSRLRLALLASIVGSFALGAALGTVGYELFPKFSMIPPVLFILWIVLKDLSTPIASIVPAAIESNSPDQLPEHVAYFRIVPDASRPRSKQRMPNVALLVDRQPRSVTTVIVDLSALSPIPKIVVDELKLLAKKLRSSGRTLLLVDQNIPEREPHPSIVGPFFRSPHDALRQEALCQDILRS